MTTAGVSTPVLRLLDTDILIDVQRNLPAATVWLATLDLAAVAVPGFVAMELLQDARNKNEARAADGLLQMVTRVWPSAPACEEAYADFRALHLSSSLGLVDALIGATARERGVVLCTFNVKHYRAVPGLTTEQPYSR